MKSQTPHINQLQTQNLEIDQTSLKISIGEVFSERNGSYINEFKLFVARFNSIPNFIHEVEINCSKASKWFVKCYQNDIKDVHYSKRYFKQSKKAEFDDIFYFIYDDLIVDFDTNQSIVRFLFRNTAIEKVESLISGIKRFKKRKTTETPLIFLLVSTRYGIECKPFEISKPSLSIEDNYNDDFKEIHKTVIKRLSKNNDKGIVLLHGKPGTGKTFYVRYLISQLQKKVIFMPPNMAGAITKPELISILIENPNSIFIIEDAENLIIDRDQDGNSPVTSLLNLSDGLLSDCLNIQVICSFNNDLSKVDTALLRKGRLIAKYEFKELDTEKAQSLSKKLGYDTKFSKPMSLSSIYNQEEIDYQKERRNTPIGFKQN